MQLKSNMGHYQIEGVFKSEECNLPVLLLKFKKLMFFYVHYELVFTNTIIIYTNCIIN